MPDNPQPDQSPAETPSKADADAAFPGPAIAPPAVNVTFSAPDNGNRESLPYAGAAQFTVQQSISWQAPYPSPDAVERFEAVLPGAFDRMLAMAERAQAAQLRRMETAQDFVQRDVRRSHYLGAAISVLAVICSTACAMTGHPTEAVALVGIPVMAVARAFVRSRETANAPGSEKVDRT